MNLQKFLKGFKKLEYDFPLQDEPSELQISNEFTEYVNNFVSRKPIYDVDYGIYDYKIRKDHREQIRELLEFEKGYNYNSKLNYIIYPDSNTKCYTVNHYIYAFGIDGCVWELYFSTYFNCRSYTPFNDTEIVQILTDLVFDCIRYNGICVMIQDDLQQPTITDFDKYDRYITRGYQCTFGFKDLENVIDQIDQSDL